MDKNISVVLPQDVFDCLRDEDIKDKTYAIWVDGSYLDKDRNKAGTGVIVSESHDRTPLFSMGYNISSLKIRKSKYPELWAATLALEDLGDLSIDRIVCDSPVTKHRIKNIRDGIGTAKGFERFRAEYEEVPELFDRLRAALNRHPDIKVKHVSRKKENIPHSDHLSRNAAKRRLARIFSGAHDLDIPCLYKIVNQDGEPRQVFFYDNMKNYDIEQFIEGSFNDEPPIILSHEK